MDKAGKRSEARSAMGIRQPQKAAGTTNPDGASQNTLDIISHALQLRSAAGQHNLTANWPCKAKSTCSGFRTKGMFSPLMRRCMPPSMRV